MGNLMRHLTTTILLLSFSLFGFGQTKTLEIPTYKNGDTSLWYQWRQKDIKQIGLSDLTKSVDSLHFRFSTETQAIDVWTLDYKIFNGSFANFTTSYDQDKYKKENPKPDKFYSKQTALDTATARRIYNIFGSLSIFSIPTEDSIKGWFPGNDGITYIIEYTTPTKYSFKTYWTPDYYKDKLKEALAIDSLAKHLETTLNMRASFGAFIDTLPFGCYHAGSIMVTCRQKSKKNRQRNK